MARENLSPTRVIRTGKYKKGVALLPSSFSDENIGTCATYTVTDSVTRASSGQTYGITRQSFSHHSHTQFSKLCICGYVPQTRKPLVPVVVFAILCTAFTLVCALQNVNNSRKENILDTRMHRRPLQYNGCICFAGAKFPPTTDIVRCAGRTSVDVFSSAADADGLQSPLG